MMKIEISIEGPIGGLSRLCKKLGLPSSLIREGLEEGLGRVLLIETEQAIDQRLLEVSRALRGAEQELVLPSPLDMRVRNLAYSEPAWGGEEYRNPFQPIPSLTVQPWSPAMGSAGAPNESAIVIDTRQSFGGGTHPTTRLCLRMVDRMSAEGVLEGKSVLDFGCGTGLLAIAARRLGASEVVAVEIDPQSAETARKNVMRNSLSETVRVREGSWEVVPETFDVILANVVPAVLLRSAGHFRPRLKEQGRAILSGFGEGQTAEISSCFRSEGLTETARSSLEGWGCLVLQHHFP